MTIKYGFPSSDYDVLSYINSHKIPNDLWIIKQFWWSNIHISRVFKELYDWIAIYRNWPMNYGIFISIVKIQMTYGYAHFNDKNSSHWFRPSVAYVVYACTGVDFVNIHIIVGTSEILNLVTIIRILNLEISILGINHSIFHHMHLRFEISEN